MSTGLKIILQISYYQRVSKREEFILMTSNDCWVGILCRNHLGRYGITLLVCMLASFMAITFSILLTPSTIAEDITWDWARISDVDRWPSSGGGTSDEVFLDISPDGSKLILSGFIQPNSLRIMKRNMIPIIDLYPPGPVENITGVHWTPNGTWVIAWGLSNGDAFDFLAVWDGSTYERVDEQFINTTGSFQTINTVLFLKNDELMAISGRDEDDISRVLVIETISGRMIHEWMWEDNASVLSLGSDPESLMCIDERGIVTSISIEDWSIIQVIEGRSTGPTADTFGPSMNRPWIIGYDDGWINFWGGDPIETAGDAFVSERGPVQGIVWAFNEPNGYYVWASPRTIARYGSVINLAYYNNSTETLIYMYENESPGVTVTMLMSDPVESGLIWAGFSDGSLGQYKVELSDDKPPEVTIEYPENRSVHNESFWVRVDFYDDHDFRYYIEDIKYIKIRIDDGDWVEIHKEMEYSRWSHYIRAANMTSGKHRITVEAYDGRHKNQTYVIFYVPGEDDESEGWYSYKTQIILISGLLLYLSVLLFLRWRRRDSNDT